MSTLSKFSKNPVVPNPKRGPCYNSKTCYHIVNNDYWDHFQCTLTTFEHLKDYKNTMGSTSINLKYTDLSDGFGYPKLGFQAPKIKPRNGTILSAI